MRDRRNRNANAQSWRRIVASRRRHALRGRVFRDLAGHAENVLARFTRNVLRFNRGRLRQFSEGRGLVSSMVQLPQPARTPRSGAPNRPLLSGGPARGRRLLALRTTAADGGGRLRERRRSAAHDPTDEPLFGWDHLLVTPAEARHPPGSGASQRCGLYFVVVGRNVRVHGSRPTNRRRRGTRHSAHGVWSAEESVRRSARWRPERAFFCSRPKLAHENEPRLAA